MIRYDLVIFDMDGTTVDTRYFHKLTFSKFFAEKNIPYDHDRNSGFGKTLNDVMQGAKIADKDIPLFISELADFYRHKVDDLLYHCRFVDGAVETIRWLKAKGCSSVLISNSKHELVEKIVHYQGESDLFDRISGASDEAVDKYHRCLDAIKTYHPAPGKILFVGDLPHDIKMAQDLRCDSCIVYNEVSWLFPNKDILRDNPPKYFIENISEIRDFCLDELKHMYLV